MSTKIIKINNTEIVLRKSSKSRLMNISVRPFVGVRITIPERVSFYEGEKLAHSKISWIEDNLQKMKVYEEAFPIYDEHSNYQTRNHRLQFKNSTKGNLSVRVKNNFIIVKYPHEKSIKSVEVQKAIRKGIVSAYREEAKEFLPKRLNDLSDMHELPFNELYIKNIRSRWGSCSGKNNINLSLHLMRLPDHLIDYVILHELAHTKVKNHSKRFWDYLDTLTGDAKRLDNELRKYRIGPH